MNGKREMQEKQTIIFSYLKRMIKFPKQINFCERFVNGFNCERFVHGFNCVRFVHGFNCVIFLNRFNY